MKNMIGGMVAGLFVSNLFWVRYGVTPLNYGATLSFVVVTTALGVIFGFVELWRTYMTETPS